MNQSRPQLFGMLAGFFLAAGLVLSAMLATTTWLKVRNSQFVTVKGSVQKNIESDLAIWSGSFRVEADTLLEAQHRIQIGKHDQPGIAPAEFGTTSRSARRPTASPGAA